MLSLAEAKVLFGRMAGAVKAMHDQESIHRDLKLENVRDGAWAALVIEPLTCEVVDPSGQGARRGHSCAS